MSLLPTFLLLVGASAGSAVATGADLCHTSVPVVPAERDMKTHLRQAKHFEKKGWIDDAVREVAMARGTPEGRTSPEVFALAAHLARRQDNIVGARCLAEATLGLNRSGAATEQARALKYELDRSFGYLVIQTAGDATSAPVRLTLPKFFGTAELKAYAERKAAVLAKGQPLPIHVALPAGAYSVSGQAVTVLAGQTQEVALHPKDTRPAWASPIVRLRGGVAFHPEQARPTPSALGTASLAATWPVWRETASALHAGLRLDGRAPTNVSSLTRVPAGGAVGAQVSGYWFLDVGLDLHLDAAFGWASLSGVGFECPLTGTACSARTSTTGPHDTLYLRDQGTWLRAAAGVDLRGIGGADAPGIGFDLAFERFAGSVDPTAGETEGLSWRVGDPSWSVISLTPGISVSIRR